MRVTDSAREAEMRTPNAADFEPDTVARFPEIRGASGQVAAKTAGQRLGDSFSIESDRRPMSSQAFAVMPVAIELIVKQVQAELLPGRSRRCRENQASHGDRRR